MEYRDFKEFEEQYEKNLPAMANAAIKASCLKADEAGLPFIVGYLAVLHASDIAKQVLALYEALGPAGIRAISKAIEKLEINDMLDQAEDVLRGE